VAERNANLLATISGLCLWNRRLPMAGSFSSRDVQAVTADSTHGKLSPRARSAPDWATEVLEPCPAPCYTKPDHFYGFL